MPHKTLLALLMATSLLAACGGPPAPDGADAAPAGQPALSKTVNVYNWGDYIAPGVIDKFEAATPLVDASLRDDPGVYPPADLRERLQPLRARSQAQSREENRIWARFRTGE